jgi:hypothetical protein
MQILANLSEAPQSRLSGILDSRETIELLKKILNTTTSTIIRQGATCALERIQWRP